MVHPDDGKVLGRWGARTGARVITPASAGYRILFTRGPDLLTPVQYRSSFEASLERAVLQSNNVSDQAIARALAVSTTAFACSEYRSTTTANVPLKVVDPSKQQLEGTPLAYFVTSSAAEILGLTVRGLLMWGRVHLRKRRNAQGWPTGLEWINPTLVRDVLGQEQVVVAYDIQNPFSGRVERVDTDEIIYMQAFDPDPAGEGLSRFEVAWRAMGVEGGIATYAAAFFINGAQPDGFLSFETPLNDAEFDDARREWQSNFKGARNAHKTAVMPGGARWNPISGVLKDLAMTDLKASEREDICAIFETDPILVGLKGAADALSANSTYSSAEVAHIRRATLPLLNTVVLPALNQQWAHRDFDRANYYTLATNDTEIPALVEANLVRSDTAINLSSATILDYNESRRIVGAAPREDYIVRDPQNALDMWREGTISLSQFHRMVGGPGLPSSGQDYWNIDGTLVPLSELPNVWKYRMLVAPSVYNSELITGEPLPQPVDPNQVVPTDQGGESVIAPQSPPVDASPALPDTTARQDSSALSAVLMLTFPNNPDLVALQGRVKQLITDTPCRWNDPQTFHITLVYMPAVDESQLTALSAALVDMPVPAMALRLGSLRVFDNVGEHAVHFRIRQNGDLAEFQETLYDKCAELGIPVSTYSDPEQYTPHITMGYADKPVRMQAFSGGRIHLKPAEMQLSDSADMVRYRISCENTTRSAPMVLQMAVSFADHQFLTVARRALSEILTQREIAAASWIHPSAWRLTLAAAENWTPNAVATLMRSVDYAQMRKQEWNTGDYVVDGTAVYLRVTGDVSAIQKSIQLDTTQAGLDAMLPTEQGILMAVLDDAAHDGEVYQAAQSFPLIANNIELCMGDQAYHRWDLRGTPMQMNKELAAWRKAIVNHGMTYRFNPEALMGWVEGIAFIQDCLDAEIAIEDIFDLAEAALRGEITLRAYPDTADAFTDELVGIIGAGQKNEISRRLFAARMRTVLRRLGLQAFRDGMNERGYDPESLSPKEVSAFNGWYQRQSGYVSSFGAEVFKQGITENEIRYRAETWTRISLYEIYVLGQFMANTEQRYIWRMDPTAENCEGCIVLNGQVHTAEEWLAENILPGNGHTPCKQGCKCGLHPTNKPLGGGNFLRGLIDDTRSHHH